MARSRNIIKKQKTQKVYLSYEGKTVDNVVEEVFSSFPSISSTGYPNRIQMTPGNFAKYTKRYHDKVVYNSDGKGMWLTGASDSFLSPPSELLATMESLAINKAIAKFMDGKQQLAADFGERQKTIDMIEKRSIQAFNILRHLRKGNIVKAIRVMHGGKRPNSKTAANLHLEFTYGWKPFVQSLFEICNKEFPPKPEIHISEKVTRRYYVMDSYKSGSQEVDGRIRGTCSFIAVMESPTASSAEKLGLTNPASVAWELVPFSFLVDWFIPISTYLSSLTAFTGYSIKDKCSSQVVDIYCTNVALPQGAWCSQHLQTCLRKTSIKLEMALFPKSPLSPGHAYNALALVRSLRRN